MSNDKRMEAVDEDEGDNLPVIERLHHLKLEVETSGPEDDFALPAEELKQYGGMTPVFKRKTTNQLKKFYTGEEDAGSKKIEEEARARCIEDGLDPDFVGTKGYPNWKEFTPGKRKDVQEFLKVMEKVIANKKAR